MKSPAKWAALCAACLCAAVVGSSNAATITLNTFATPPASENVGTIGFAYVGDGFVGSVYTSGTGTTLYKTPLTGGVGTVFAPGINIPGGIPEEHFVAASLGLGGFPSRDVYVAINGGIVHIDHSGTTSNTFVTGLSGDVRGILFDAVGTFNHDMLVTTSSGTVYRIDSAGNATPLAYVGEDTEGLDIAPLGSFGALSGQLFVASEGSGKIRAISTSGNITDVTTVSSAEELTFVPLNLGASGNPVEGFYGSNYTPNVLKANADQFYDPSNSIDYRGDIVVTGETSHLVSLVHWNGTNAVVSQIGQFPNQPEDGIFVTAAIVQGNAVPLPSAASAGLALGAVLLVGRIIRRRCVPAAVI